MFRSRTTFIIGAGAGYDIKMPLGVDLLKGIARDFNFNFDGYRRALTSGDKELYEAFQRYVDLKQLNNDELENLNISISSIARSLPQAISVDNYIDNHAGDSNTVFLGKMAIVNAIAKAEQASHLYFDRQERNSTINPATVDGTWFNFLFRKLCEGHNSPEKFSESLRNITFINFNYDRCLEHFLFETIKVYWRLNDEQAISVLQNTTFLHPYGTLGNLGWQNPKEKFAFGGKIRTEYLLEAHTKIKTFTEQIKEDSLLDSIRSAVAEADTLIFLGFAFHDQNIQLLSPQCEMATKRIFGTAIGISRPDLEDIKETLLSEFGFNGTTVWHSIDPEHNCTKIFQDHWRLIGK